MAIFRFLDDDPSRQVRPAIEVRARTNVLLERTDGPGADAVLSAAEGSPWIAPVRREVVHGDEYFVHVAPALATETMSAFERCQLVGGFYDGLATLHTRGAVHGAITRDCVTASDLGGALSLVGALSRMSESSATVENDLAAAAQVTLSILQRGDAPAILAAQRAGESAATLARAVRGEYVPQVTVVERHASPKRRKRLLFRLVAFVATVLSLDALGGPATEAVDTNAATEAVQGVTVTDGTDDHAIRARPAGSPASAPTSPPAGASPDHSAASSSHTTSAVLLVAQNPETTLSTKAAGTTPTAAATTSTLAPTSTAPTTTPPTSTTPTSTAPTTTRASTTTSPAPSSSSTTAPSSTTTTSTVSTTRATTTTSTRATTTTRSTTTTRATTTTTVSNRGRGNGKGNGNNG